MDFNGVRILSGYINGYSLTESITLKTSIGSGHSFSVKGDVKTKTIVTVLIRKKYAPLCWFHFGIAVDVTHITLLTLGMLGVLVLHMKDKKQYQHLPSPGAPLPLIGHLHLINTR